MRRGFGFIGLLVTVIVLVIVGAIAYNVGWSDGVNTHLPAATQAADGTTVPAYYYGGPHYWGGPGFGFFGILWFLLIVFGLFWLFRLAFFGRRMWGGGGWGGGWGYGHKGGYGPGIPPGIDERMQDWHKKAHGEPGSSGSTPPPPPPDTRTV
jgi:hypothetical protein